MKTQLMLFDRDYPTNMSELRPNKEVMSRFSTSSKRLSPMPPRCPGNRNATHNWMLAERNTLWEAHAASVLHVKVHLWVSCERHAPLHTAVAVPPKIF